MSSANVVIAGTDAISNAYQGMIGAAADKKRRRMQSLLGIGQNLEDVVTQVKEAKDKRTEESESKALTEALSLGLRDGDPSKAIDTIAATSATSPRVAQAKASLLLKLMDDKRQVEQSKATLKFQEDQLAALKADRAADNWRQTWQNFRMDQDRDAARKQKGEIEAEKISLKAAESKAKSDAVTLKIRSKAGADGLRAQFQDAFGPTWDANKYDGKTRSDWLKDQFKGATINEDDPYSVALATERNKLYNEAVELDQKDVVIKARAEQREIEQTKANATPLLETLDRFATAAGGNIKGKLLPKQGQDDVSNDILGAIMALMENPVTKKLIKAGVDPEYLQSKIEAGIRKAIGAGKPEEDARETEARDKLMLARYRTARGLNAVQPVNPKDFEAWKAEQEGQPKVDSKQSKPQTGEPAQTKTINGVTWVKTETGWKKQE